MHPLFEVPQHAHFVSLETGAREILASLITHTDDCRLKLLQSIQLN